MEHLNETILLRKFSYHFFLAADSLDQTTENLELVSGHRHYLIVDLHNSFPSLMLTLMSATIISDRFDQKFGSTPSSSRNALQTIFPF